MAIWQFRSTSHGSSSLLSPLSPPISLFLSFSLLLLLSPCFSLQFPSPSLVHGRGCLPTLSSWTCVPSLHYPNLSANYIEGWLQRMKCGILKDVSWLYVGSPGCVFWCRDLKVTLFEDSNEMQENWAKASPFEIKLLSKAALPSQTVSYHITAAITFMHLTNSDCFPCHSQ